MVSSEAGFEQAFREALREQRGDLQRAAAVFLQRHPEYLDEIGGRLGKLPDIEHAEIVSWEHGLELLEADLESPLPESIGPYRVIARLGSGGQAEVFRCVHQKLTGRDVVVKLGRADLSPQECERIHGEAGQLIRLVHPNINRVYDVGTWEGRPYLAMEFREGVSLDTLLVGRRLSFRESAGLIARLAETVDFMHQQGILHRDLKPSNVLVTRENEPVLVDFGFAGDSSTTQSGSGTPEYMAPEQAGGGQERLGPQSDLFAIGAILYEMLTGRRAYSKINRQAESLRAQLEAAAEQIVPPRQIRSDIPRWLERICMKSLHPDPDQRYPTAKEQARALRKGSAARFVPAAVAAGILVAFLATALLMEKSEPVVPPATSQARLSGELSVRVFAKDATGSPLTSVLERPDAPLVPGEMLRMDVELSDAVYLYLFYFDSNNAVTQLYPSELTADDTAKRSFHIPPNLSEGFMIEGETGTDVVVAVATRRELPDTIDLTQRLKPHLSAIRESVSASFRLVDGRLEVPLVSRSIDPQPQASGHVVLRMLADLGDEFEWIQAVGFPCSD